MIELTPRQIQILRAIIEEFIETAQPVGSDTIDRKYNIGVSPATIRNEMVYLSKQDYLDKSHVSGGRVPTPKAFRLYINELMREEELSVADEVSAKEKIWESRTQLNKLLKESSHVLADRSNAIGIAMTDDQDIFHAGYSNLLDMPEFFDIRVMKRVLSIIEQSRILEEIFSRGDSFDKIQVVYGREIGEKELEQVGLMFVSVNALGHHCRLGVIGSERFNYPYLIPMMKYFKSLIEQMV
ncbi:MAG: Heat-inducible transcription repressor hrcA [Microgenomates bacterium 39_7]|nr:MAG: Heat-inducible transcription repressor hrcA [Microgenomates bacterium 39_7]